MPSEGSSRVLARQMKRVPRRPRAWPEGLSAGRQTVLVQAEIGPRIEPKGGTVEGKRRDNTRRQVELSLVEDQSSGQYAMALLATGRRRQNW